MNTIIEPSQARRTARNYSACPFLGGTFPAPSCVSGPNYGVSYYADHSVLCTYEGRIYRVLDEERTYHRDSIEHAMRCLGRFGPDGCRERAAKLASDRQLPGSLIWIDGVQWSLETGHWVDVA